MCVLTKGICTVFSTYMKKILSQYIGTVKKYHDNGAFKCMFHQYKWVEINISQNKMIV